jgi:hypothetical protein
VHDSRARAKVHIRNTRYSRNTLSTNCTVNGNEKRRKARSLLCRGTVLVVTPGSVAEKRRCKDELKLRYPSLVLRSYSGGSSVRTAKPACTRFDVVIGHNSIDRIRFSHVVKFYEY